MALVGEKLFVLGERLELLIAEEDCCQWELANELLIERKSIIRWVQGYSLPNAWIVKWLAVRFNVNADWLLGLTSERKETNYDKSILTEKNSRVLRGRGKRRYGMIPEFCDRLNDLLAERGLSKEALAWDIGKNRKTAYSWTNGKTVPNAFILRKLAAYFHVSADWLLGLSEQRDGGNPDDSKRVADAWVENRPGD